MSFRVFIAEKPELAQAIVEGLGGGERKKGYYDCGNDLVTWCYGHMLQLKDPEEYDIRYEKWSLDDLPMFFIPWGYKIGSDKKEQINIIFDLLKRSTSCVNACDTDAAGQMICDEILKFVDYKKPVERVLINDNNLAPVKKALLNMRPNSDFYGLYQSEEARSVADQLYGYNLTRAYTLVARKAGYQGVLSIGRVQTPILGLVVRRDLEHESHSKSYFYTLAGEFNFNGIKFQAKLKVLDTDEVDDKNRIISERFATDLASSFNNSEAKIVKKGVFNKKESPPLPYNLLKLQSDASRKFGLKPDKVKDITQNLREKYKLITYNRSDCQYLSDEHHADAGAVLDAIAITAPMLSRAKSMTDIDVKSKAFNSSKVTAHHAIIPTIATADFSKLNDNEQKIYILIARAYIAQFYPNYEYQQIDLLIASNNREFTVTSKIPKVEGWKVLYRKDVGNDEVETVGDSTCDDFTSLNENNKGVCIECDTSKQETKPPARYTIATLLNDLTRIAKYVQNPDLKKILIEKDKGNAGEHGGIGTSATRDSIIKSLFEREFLSEQGKSIISTKTARQFYSLLPDIAKFPDMTAVWHEQQKEIESGKMSTVEFIENLNVFIKEQVEEAIQNGVNELDIELHECPKCKSPLNRINGTKGYFWGCSGYENGCKTAFPELNGKPDFNKKPATVSKLHKCMICSSGLIRRSYKKKFFWGCSGYPDCEQSYPDMKGRPNYSKPKITGNVTK